MAEISDTSSALTLQMAEAIKHVETYQDNEILNEFVFADIAGMYGVDSNELERLFWEVAK